MHKAIVVGYPVRIKLTTWVNWSVSLLKHNFDRCFKSRQDGTEKFTAQPRTVSKTTIEWETNEDWTKFSLLIIILSGTYKCRYSVWLSLADGQQ